MACLFVMMGVVCIYMSELMGLAARWHPHQSQRETASQAPEGII
jgi:hypothetical protein